ncbi:unnamed protein product [Coccothraustes coccothraustes]
MPLWNGKLLLLLALGKEPAQRWQILPSFGCSLRNLVDLDECERKPGFCCHLCIRWIVGRGSPSSVQLVDCAMFLLRGVKSSLRFCVEETH